MRVSDEDGRLLVRQARRIVEGFLRKMEPVDEQFERRFSFPSGVFVTLSKNRSLRGCIGYPLPGEALCVALRDAAVAAAARDPRFPPVGAEELDEITFEVTVLTEPKAIRVESFEEYPGSIRVGRDGLMVRKGSSSGLLLPQVPLEHGWGELEFLERTCEKAGLGKDAWKQSGTEVLRFEGAAFAESRPGGEISRVELRDSP